MWMAQYEERSKSVQSTDAAALLWQEWLRAFDTAARKTVKQHRVCTASRSWYPKELAQERRDAGKLVRESVGEEQTNAKEKLARIRTKIRSSIRSGKQQAVEKRNRRLEANAQQPKLLWKQCHWDWRPA